MVYNAVFTFIQLNGAYLGFWLVLWAASMVGVYWAVRLALQHSR